MRSVRSAAVLATSGLLVFALACIDFRQTNPFDPGAPVTIAILPETLFSVAGGVVQFSFATVPPLTDPRASWSVGTNDLYETNGTGLLYSAGAPLWPETETVPITISVGLHYEPLLPSSQAYTRTISGSVVITQRLVRIQARCTGTPA